LTIQSFFINASEEDTKEAPEEDEKEEVAYGIVISLRASG
jgi:hypothetical protein